MKMSWKKLVGGLLGLAVVGVLVQSSTALAGFGGGCGSRYCPDVWDPVQCSNGVIYSNACYARRACATGCHPVWE